jgi:predicted metalloprotease
VQQYLAKQLGLDISNVPPALIESALQHENEYVMDTMHADGGSSSGGKAAAKKGGKGGVVVVLVVLAIAGIAGVVMLKRKRDQENGGAHSRLEMTEFQNPVARDTTYSDAIGGSDA